MTIAKAIEELERLVEGVDRFGIYPLFKLFIAEHGPTILAALRAQGEPRCTDCTDAQQCAAYERGVVAGRRAPRAVPEGYALVPELTDEQIVEIRDDHLPSQGDSFDCIAFARAILAAAKEGSNG